MSEVNVKPNLNSPVREFWRLTFPAQPYVKATDKVFGGIGAFVGILGLLWAARYAMPQSSLLVVASMGASAVLFFAAPNSPLAQPWAFAGGHLVSALSGVTCYQIIPDAFTAAAAAVSIAVLLMHFLHCLHPPGGATALFAVLGGDAVHDLGFGYVLMPVGLNVALFLSLAILVNNYLIPRRNYPSCSASPLSSILPASPRDGFEQSGPKTVLRDIDLIPDGHEEISKPAPLNARGRVFTTVKVSDVMQENAPHCVYGDELEAIWELISSDPDTGVPVIDCECRVVGIVTIADFLKLVKGNSPGKPTEEVSGFIHRAPETSSAKVEVVEQIMTSPVITISCDACVDSLISLFAAEKVHHVPVVDTEQRLMGMVKQSDLLEFCCVNFN